MDDRAGDAPGLAGEVEQPARRAGEVQRRPREPERLVEAVADGIAREGERARDGARHPAVAVARIGLRRDVEQERHELDRGEPVDEAVVGLADDADPAVRQVVGDPQLPERAVVLQRRGHDLVDDPAEVRARRAQDVVGDVKGGVVDPDGVAEPERDRGELLAVARRAAEAAVDVGEHVLEARWRTVGGRVEERRPAHVHRRPLGLERQERGIECRKRSRAHVAEYVMAVTPVQPHVIRTGRPTAIGSGG